MVTPPPHGENTRYGTDIDQGVDVGRGGLEKYVVLFSWVLKLVGCPVDVCLARVNNLGIIRVYFMYWNWKANVAIIQEGPESLPMCLHCGMHMPEARLIKHR